MSRLFCPYRTVGLTCGGAQQHVQTLGGETFLAASVGKAFVVWRADHLSLAMVSAPQEHALTCVRARVNAAPLRARA